MRRRGGTGPGTGRRRVLIVAALPDPVCGGRPPGRPPLLPEPSACLDRDERLLGAHLQLLHGPRVAVRVGEAEEGGAVLVAEVDDLTRLDAAAEQLLAGGL